jgi:hypothetical protein
MTDLPDTIRIGAFDYKVLRPQVVDGDESWGAFSAAKGTLTVATKVPTKTHLQEVFLHELLHGLWHHSHLGKKADEEHAVRLLSEGLMCFIRSNPWVLDWLKDA